MRRSQTRIRLKGTRLDDGGRITKLDDDTAVFVPTRIEGTIESADWDVDFTILNVAEFDEPVISELRIAMREPELVPITSEALRSLKLGEVRRMAVKRASTMLRLRNADQYEVMIGTRGDAESLRAVFRTDRRKSVTLDEVQRAAEVYLSVKSDPTRRDTINAVKDALNVSRATAGRRIDRARKLGLIPTEASE